ncbi:ABC transporter permease [Bythopirellula goksoeyrii]|uniref:Dipeptide transport system permease protein DppB n=1 Tax=Bythopirellula goksoeyrii TaxID=1400387 RepID=A0A5B9Q620_9BACT|nr:ABC transporter permease subunit [Bythopirellula goksoeyrii]QEG34478.1 Dipeptide transport system permease protein DppB [Bythopirellula goksoeyrii]
MIRFMLRRLFWMAITLLVVFTVSFFLMRSVPGGPFDRERVLEPEIMKNIEKRYNLDKPLYQQFLLELGKVLRGDLGYSYKINDYSVNEIIAEGLPISVALGSLALVFATTLGLVAGVTSAVLRGTWGDVLLMLIATLGIALPNFVIAGICIILFVFLIPLFPAAGWGNFNQLVLPAFCLGAPYAAYIARIARTSMLDVLSQDHIRTARAKGVGPLRLILVHALRGALLPVVSFIGPAVAGILTGSLVVEQIFAIPGLGSHFVQAALQKDYTLAMGLVLLYTVLLYSMNWLVDLSYALLDPRVELS